MRSALAVAGSSNRWQSGGHMRLTCTTSVPPELMFTVVPTAVTLNVLLLSCMLDGSTPNACVSSSNAHPCSASQLLLQPSESETETRYVRLT